MDATWHTRPRGSATQTRAAPTWRVLYIYSLFIITYMNGSSAFPIWEGLLTLYIVGSYKPDDSLFLFPMGLIHTDFNNAGDVARRGAMDRRRIIRSTRRSRGRGPLIAIKHVT